MVTIAGLEFFWGKKKEEPPKKVELNEFQLFCQRLAGNIGYFKVPEAGEELKQVTKGDGKERVKVYIVDLDEAYIDRKMTPSEAFYPEQFGGMVPIRVEKAVLQKAIKAYDDDDNDTFFDSIGETYIDNNRGRFPVTLGGSGNVLILLRQSDHSVGSHGWGTIENWEAGIFKKSEDPDVASWLEKFRKNTLKGISGRKYSWVNR